MGLSNALSGQQGSASIFDDRIVEIAIELSTGTLTFDGSASIVASGRKYTEAQMNECTLRISNLTRDQRNNILSQSSFLKLGQNPPVKLLVDVGRVSTGTFRLFEGDIVSSNITQPPDVTIELQSLNSNFAAAIVAATSQSTMVPLRVIAQDIATRMGVALVFHAKDKQIENYSHSGSLWKEVRKLNLMGDVRAFVDNSTLYVLDRSIPLPSPPVKINAASGMIGIPQVTQNGVIVRMMINNAIRLGGPVTVESQINPAANGSYYVTDIGFEVASRDLPFWYTLACQTADRYIGTV